MSGFCGCGHTPLWHDGHGCLCCDCLEARDRTKDAGMRRGPITFYRDENRPVEVGTPVYDADGQVVAHVVNVADDGSITIRAPKPEEAS